MTDTPYDNQPCRLVSMTGTYLTPNNTFSPDPAEALTAERWLLQRKAQQINTPTLIIRAA